MDDDGATAEIYDPGGDVFTPVERMTTERVGHTATLLPTGQVLLAGGFDRHGVLATAELYDPESGVFSPAGRMGTKRGGFTATPLRSGEVILAGGFDGQQQLASAELYNPATRTFTPTGAMRSLRGGHAAAALPDGRILITGGSDGEHVLATTEIYDPVVGTFSPGPEMTLVRHKHAAMTLRDGTVLIVGGSDARDGYGRYASTEIYDPADRAFRAGPSMAAPRYKLPDAVALLPTGHVLVGGGAERVEVYVPGAGVFGTAAGTIGAPLAFTTATLLRDGRVVIVGGYDEQINPTAQAWVYHPGE
jgi:hypothetical protein